MTDLRAAPQRALDAPTTHQQTDACTAEQLEPEHVLYDLDAYGDELQQATDRERSLGVFQHHFKVRAALLLRHQSPMSICSNGSTRGR